MVSSVNKKMLEVSDLCINKSKGEGATVSKISYREMGVSSFWGTKESMSR